MRRIAWMTALLLVGLAMSVTHAQRRVSAGWRYFGGDKAFTRYAPLDQINHRNVASLRIVWRQTPADPSWTKAFPGLRISGNLRSTPIIVNGLVNGSVRC